MWRRCDVGYLWRDDVHTSAFLPHITSLAVQVSEVIKMRRDQKSICIAVRQSLKQRDADIYYWRAPERLCTATRKQKDWSWRSRHISGNPSLSITVMDTRKASVLMSEHVIGIRSRLVKGRFRRSNTEHGVCLLSRRKDEWLMRAAFVRNSDQRKRF